MEKVLASQLYMPTTFIGYFYILTFIIGFGAIVYLSNNSEYLDSANKLIGSNNMAAIHLSHAIGGDIFLGFISAVAFATILAVVSGLTLAGASAIGRDIYVYVLNNGKADERKELIVSKVSSVIIWVANNSRNYFQGQMLHLWLVWHLQLLPVQTFLFFVNNYLKRLTTNGAFYGGFIGLILPIALVILGPTIWVDVFGYEKPIFPYKYPGLFSVTIAFFSIILISYFDKSGLSKTNLDKFDKLLKQSYLGRK